MQIDNVVKLYIIMIGIQAIKGSWWTLMNEINKTLWWKHDNSLVNDGDPLTNLTTPFKIFYDVHKWSFNMMVKVATDVLLDTKPQSLNALMKKVNIGSLDPY
jgi:hypothetical protein